MPTPTRYCNDTHLRAIEERIFTYQGATFAGKIETASVDVLRDLEAAGVFDRHQFEYAGFRDFSLPGIEGDPFDDSEKATVILSFTATADGDLVLPAKTQVYAQNIVDTAQGAPLFETDQALTVTAGETDTVSATALYSGNPSNVAAAVITGIVDNTLPNFSAVSNALAASGGVDHQLARVTAYRALAMICLDLFRQEGDLFWTKMREYQRLYKEEKTRVLSSGVRVDFDGDDSVSESEDRNRHGSFELERS